MTRLTRRDLLAAGGAAFGAGLGSGLWAPQAALAYESTYEMGLPEDLVRGEPATVTAVRTAQPIVAMTYDDGPHPRLTPTLLDALKARGLSATFYLIGKSVVTWPDIVRRIADEGHEIGNHTWSHPNMARLGDSAMLREIDRTSEAIQKITGRPPVTFRPPYGAFTARQRRLLFRSRDLPTVLWSVDPLD
jgi:peptidoglycan/xylan/chitin deacetylase (PgdA/CDA1 family)